MIIVRPINRNDSEAFAALAYSAEVTLPSIPKNREILQKNLTLSEETFAKKMTKPEGGFYLFVLEDSSTQEILGSSAIAVSGQGEDISFVYKCESIPLISAKFNIEKSIELLQVVSHTTHPAEICALFLAQQWRREGLGKLLSFSRMLFIAAFPERFNEKTMALMRGVVDEHGNSPFWNALGRHFLNKELDEAEFLYRLDKRSFEDLLPKYPIYTSLLPKAAQEVIGRPHNHTERAMAMLQGQGFAFHHEIDIFDGGPKIIAATKSIRTIQESKLTTIAAIVPEINSKERYLIGNERIHFRAGFSALSFNDNREALIPQATASALQLSPGDPLRYILQDEMSR